MSNDRDYDQLKSKIPTMMFLQKYLPDGKKVSNEWVALNPTRSDKKLGSFKVNLDTCLWADFATGDKGGDLISLYAYIHRLQPSRAYDDLSAIFNHCKPTEVATGVKKKLKRYHNIHDPLPAHEGHYVYYDYNCAFLGFVIRLQNKTATGNKIFMPFIEDGPEHSIPTWWPTLFKPIYKAELLKVHPNKPVLIVEGEKTTDAAQLLFPNYVCITWMGGCSNANKADITYLKGRHITLWPDNDDQGIKAMQILSLRLVNHAESVTIADIGSLGVEKGWDLADYDSAKINFTDLELILKPPFDTSTYPNLNKTTKTPLDTTKNLKHLLKHYNITVRWNMMKRLREVIVPEVQFYNEESENASLTYITNLAVVHGLSIRRIDKHLDAISWEAIYHPIRDWILSEPLKTPLLDEFLACIQTTNDALSHVLIKRWLVSAIAVLFNEGDFCAQGVLVIQGAQGTHKTSFIQSLVPSSFKAIKSGMSVDPSRKDDVFTASEYWIAELGELDATFRKADIARLKSHINNEEDTLRRPHAIRNSKMIRRTLFAATVNESRYLIDATGNRRWWTISIIEKINTRHGLDMQQIWREAYELWLAGESPVLSPEELSLLNSSNESFEFLEPFEEKLDVYFNWDNPDRVWMNATQVLANIGYDKPTKSDVTKMGCLLTRRKVTKGCGRLRYSYSMPCSNFDTLKTVR